MNIKAGITVANASLLVDNHVISLVLKNKVLALYMYISNLSVQGYKFFDKNFKIQFNSGLSVLIGENGCGKTGIIDSLRTILQEDEFGRSGIRDHHFHKAHSKDALPSKQIKISVTFSDLDEEQSVIFLPWTELKNEAQLTLLIENKANNYGRYKRKMWGGVSSSSMFEWELFDFIQTIYLPPLRDAELKLEAGRGSRISRLIKRACKKELEEAKNSGESHELVKKIASFNKDLSSDEKLPINPTNDIIKNTLKEALGNVFGQITKIQFSEGNFDRILENLKLMFFPSISGFVNGESQFRSICENSLGYNNLLYLATVLAELVIAKEDESHCNILLIEEPEAHLHPQLQIKLLKYLETVSSQSNIQVIVTTHSPILASSVDVKNLIHLSKDNDLQPCATNLSSCNFSDNGNFVNRWLDATKSTLLFSKGVILVEGIAEAILIPELAKILIKSFNASPENKERLIMVSTLEEAGISVINMNGIYFKHFFPFFCNLESFKTHIPIKCAGLTDFDPPKKDDDNNEIWPIEGHKLESTNPCKKLVNDIKSSKNVRLFMSPLKTLEYDLSMTGENYLQIKEVLTNKFKCRFEKIEKGDKDIKAKYSKQIYTRVETYKGEFAQVFADELSKSPENISIPKYIEEAIFWSLGVIDE
ncbi:AAA family ATPase [bacterium]|nr:AAA family ATPase [bacterium]